MQKFSKFAIDTPLSPFLLYGGDESFEYLNTQVVGWDSVQQFLSK